MLVPPSLHLLTSPPLPQPPSFASSYRINSSSRILVVCPTSIQRFSAQ